ncbi:hypothetical protein [Phenylobacterium sp.]|uniref:hypothetical protein n=1 Tax=Phenylobacterium sp. TaxID=1871053 RepID=UPI002730DC10|nr:hypothetical protein [Phenylobacterium sp.]MDP1598577.1 hypothetical protein [Phenylobacterium sp.]
MKVFTLSMMFGLAATSVAFAQGSTLMSGYTKSTATFTSAPAKVERVNTATKSSPGVVKIDNKQPVYIYKAPMATRPLKTW